MKKKERMVATGALRDDGLSWWRHLAFQTAFENLRMAKDSVGVRTCISKAAGKEKSFGSSIFFFRRINRHASWTAGQNEKRCSMAS